MCIFIIKGWHVDDELICLFFPLHEVLQARGHINKRLPLCLSGLLSAVTCTIFWPIFFEIYICQVYQTCKVLDEFWKYKFCRKLHCKHSQVYSYSQLFMKSISKVYFSNGWDNFWITLEIKILKIYMENSIVIDKMPSFLVRCILKN